MNLADADTLGTPKHVLTYEVFLIQVGSVASLLLLAVRVLLTYEEESMVMRIFNPCGSLVAAL